MPSQDRPIARLLSLATAVPSHLLTQSAISGAAAKLFSGNDSPYPRLRRIYENAGIRQRYSTLPLEELEQARGWRLWHEAFQSAALLLLEEVARRALTRAGLEPAQVDTLLVACSTGFAVPSLDALLLDRVPFPRTVERVPLVGYGCAGGILGLSRAAAMARARPGSIVLFLTVELCTLTFRPKDRSSTNLVATALFGDGAAAAVVACGDHPDAPGLGPHGEYCWPESEEIMGWDLQDDGVGIRLSPSLPQLIRRDARGLIEDFLDRNHLSLGNIDHWVLHPGGAKVLASLQDCLGLAEEELLPARRVLRDYGNMSAPTVLFVLQEILMAGAAGRFFCLAFGPGFTAAFLLLESNGHWPLSRSCLARPS